jgi:ABC-type dipeptide transport system, periplasmic component
MMFRLGAGALASFLIAGAALTGSANADTATKKKIIFNVGVTSDMVSPNPFKACCGSEYEMMFMNYDMLFGFSKDDLSASSDSGLAESYTKNADNTSFTFKIRDGIKWSDGKPLTAADIVFTYTFILNNHMGAFINYLDAKSSPTFAAPNATTFTWKTELSTIAPLTPPWIPIDRKSVV